jgi:hypothetical protein
LEQNATTSPPKTEHTSADISAQPLALLQDTEPPGKKELLLPKTPLNDEELPNGQDGITVPPKAEHASAGISAQPPSLLQDTRPPCKEEPLLSARAKTCSADSMSDVQEKCKPVARTSAAKTKNLFM